jgi:hypothetical protein
VGKQQTETIKDPVLFTFFVLCTEALYMTKRVHISNMIKLYTSLISDNLLCIREWSILYLGWCYLIEIAKKYWHILHRDTYLLYKKLCVL